MDTIAIPKITRIIENRIYYNTYILYTILGTLVCTIILLLIVWYVRTKKSKDTILLIGPIGSGKTSLLYQLKLQRFVQTVTTLTTTYVPLKLTKNKKNVEKKYIFIDIPGCRDKNISIKKHISTTATILYFVDSTKPMLQENTSQLLYSLLSSLQIQNHRVPIIIVITKIDEISLYGNKVSDIKIQLEKTIDTIHQNNIRICLSKTNTGDTIKREQEDDVLQYKYTEIPTSEKAQPISHTSPFTFATSMYLVYIYYILYLFTYIHLHIGIVPCTFVPTSSKQGDVQKLLNAINTVVGLS